MSWRRSESTERPQELDTESSATTVYVRRNIAYLPPVEPTEDDPQGKPGVWQYDENAVPKSEWESYQQTAQLTANMDYIAMMSGIDIPE